jgi:hypothetical protein
MRKLLAVAAASAGLILSTSIADASSTLLSYTDHHKTYTLCVTNGGSGDLGYDTLAEINFGGLVAEPSNVTVPAGWNSASFQAGSTWTLVLFTNPATGLGLSSSSFCGFSFKVAGKGKPDRSAHPAQLWFYSNNGTGDPNNPITVTAS